MTNSAALQNGHIYVQLSNHYTATVRNANDFRTLIANENEEKSIMEIKEIWNVTPEFEAEIKEIIAEFKGEPEVVAAQPKKINKRTANKINRLFAKFVDAGIKAWELNQQADDYDNEMGSWERKEARKTAEKLEKLEGKIEEELSEYLISKEILTGDDFEAYLTNDNCEKFTDLCCEFLDVFQTVWAHIEYA